MKIFYFCNGCSPGWHNGMAMDEDGHCIAQHACSDHVYLRTDLIDRRKAAHDARYPDGWEVEFVDSPRTHEGLQAAYQKNQAMAKAAKEASS